jgi:hypothetical protein
MGSKINKLASLLVVALLAIGTFAFHASRPVEAAVDSWSGHQEELVPFLGSVTAGTTAAVYTAVTNKAINVRAITLTNSASGYVALYNGSSAVAGNVIGVWAVIANTPLVLNEDMLGQGVITTVGTGLYVSGTTGTVTLTARVRKDKVSPR